MIILNDKLYFQIQIFKIADFNENYHAYQIKKTEENLLISTDSLYYHHPFDAYNGELKTDLIFEQDNSQNNTNNIQNDEEEAFKNSENQDLVNKIRQILNEQKNLKNIPEFNSKNFRIWRQGVIRLIGSLLMLENNNSPSKQVCIEYAKALIISFPCLKNNDTQNGFEHIYNPETNSGFLAWYIRNNRSKNPFIKTRVYKRKIDETENEETYSSLSIEEKEDLILFAKNKFINIDEDKRDTVNSHVRPRGLKS
ncbi:unnamed protein product [Brachionus calyciflorus]|uniref:Uncharacterized protein n=1 Tax=Brachionus calyciflorus TaxID=104777 RepID=A0A814EYN5_9BILA|nr:unnamed protein product [Brachionus calyciflorus]